jgi:phospholipid/cholesterol/gamma-HCH transport system substrate-binding protein
MRSRTVREGSVGLMILGGVGIFIGLGMWLRGLHPGNRSFRTVIEFANIGGVQSGSPVRYRGVTVGRIVSIQPGPNGVEVQVDITPADLVIPSDSEVSVNQSGLLGESVLDFFPRKSLPDGAVTAKPLDRDCNQQLIVCDGSRLKGQIGISTDELLRASIKFADLYGNPKFFDNVNTLTRNSSMAAAEIAQLSRDVAALAKAAKGELGTFSATARSFNATAQSIGNTADQFSLTAVQVNSLITANRTTLVSTLNNLDQTSGQLRLTVGRLAPVLDRVSQGELIRNLETLSTNAAQASVNLRDASQALNSPTNLVVLQQTLDSARATFQNAQKITADLDELTGDPALRDSLRNLIKGLGGLVSSTQQLQQQAQMAQVLAPIAAPQAAEQARREAVSGSAAESEPQPPAPMMPVEPSPQPLGAVPRE